jgi:hypothetical protein
MGYGQEISDAIGAQDDMKIKGGTDGTIIGNTGDRLRVEANVTVVPASSTFGTILYQNEVSISSKTETDMTGMTRTIASGKTFVLTCFTASYDTQSPIYVRIKKQTAGGGSFVTQFRITLKQHGQDASQVTIPIPFGIAIATATDVIKVTYESAIAKGTLWAAFTGIEY